MDYLYKFKDGMTIVKDDMSLGDHCMHYSDDWESLLSFQVPGKMRKTKQLLNYNESVNIINKISYGVLSFFDEIPYSIPLDHIYMNGKLYFHTSKTGYKINGVGKQISYIVVEDCGINEEKTTHNHRSVYMLGILEEVENKETKKDVLETLVHTLCPTQKVDITDQMIDNVNILELDIQYMIGKEHIR